MLATGVPIAGAVVSTEAGGYLATTSSTGAYTISNVMAGPYTLTAGAVGIAVTLFSLAMTWRCCCCNAMWCG